MGDLGKGDRLDAEGRRARREERARRAWRRRLIGIATVVLALVAACGAIAALVRGGGRRPVDTPAAISAPSVRTTAPAATAASAPAAHSGDVPSAREQSEALARVRRVGVPLYRTPGAAGKVVALTFDDGPGPYSETTVRTLARYGMRATFFLCGTAVAQFPETPAIEATVGAMGDHSWSHAFLPGLPAATMLSEIARTQAIVERTSGAPVRVFRPPYGARTPAIDATAARLGMIQVLWSVESGDSAGVGWEQMLARIEATLAPGDIVLFHENRGQTQKVINRLIPWMKREGWRSVSVPEMLAMDPPSERFLRDEAGRSLAR
jgi:peptidoglycan-N-acetylglucosamine deacetylase